MMLNDDTVVLVPALALVSCQNKHAVARRCWAHELHILRKVNGDDNVRMELLPDVLVQTTTLEAERARLLAKYGQMDKRPAYVLAYQDTETSLEKELARAAAAREVVVTSVADAPKRRGKAASGGDLAAALAEPAPAAVDVAL